MSHHAGMQITKHDTDHYEDRPEGAKPDILVLHYTETRDLKEAEDYFTGRVPHPSGGRVSVHYMVDIDGGVHQYVDEDKRAWHAGVGYWRGCTDVNSHSIGVEIVHPGHKYGYGPFPDAQIDAVIALCQDVVSRHEIEARNVVAHSDIAPDRKIDPGELFPWDKLAAQGVGRVAEALHADVAGLMQEPDIVKEMLLAYGYDPQQPLDVLLSAFQRHFVQDAFVRSEQGRLTQQTVLCLLSLIK